MREWDAFTMQEEPISSIDLMERAALACVHWLEHSIDSSLSFYIFCGKGNNGGDGLAIARILFERGYEVHIAILENGQLGSHDFQINLERIRERGLNPVFISSIDRFPQIGERAVIVDALFGTGLSRPLVDLPAALVTRINQTGLPVISIDLPSGLLADRPESVPLAVQATHTLSFQCYKRVLLCAQWAAYFGSVHILDIGLSPNYIPGHPPLFRVMDDLQARKTIRNRSDFSHKGNFGHAALVAGSPGMMGAVLLAGKSCLKSGVGKLTLYIPWSEREIPQSALPEAMVQSIDLLPEESFIADDLPYKALGIGPGWGVTTEHQNILKKLLKHFRGAMVLDADALNLLASHPELWSQIPPGTILTPHPGEAIRLFGRVENEIDRQQQLMEVASKHNIIIVYKGHRTFIALPSPAISVFNSTGNSGLAKGGSGDCLTGIITSFLAQGYPPEQAACLAVYIHGLASEILLNSRQETAETMLPGSLPDTFSMIFRSLMS